ncbi:MAG: hypothetical protein U9Q81_25710 [Pseudomonadota bacterium]|nr:hypothetical protein [Pseudomonadota bacterium]
MDLHGWATTDRDGRIALRIEARDLPPIGVYDLHFRVRGDSSSTGAQLRVVPEGTKTIVVDIDGTLTTDDVELFEDIFVELMEPLLDDYVPEARVGAVGLTERRYYGQGYLLVYLTGRPYWLTEITRRWLETKDMAPGHLHLTDSNGESVPDEGGVGRFKAEYVEHLTDLGLDVTYAYGNAATDIYAYEKAGVPKSSTFIIGPNGGKRGTVDLGDNYIRHNQDIRDDGPAEQPFDWQ